MATMLDKTDETTTSTTTVIDACEYEDAKSDPKIRSVIDEARAYGAQLARAGRDL